MQLKCGIDPWQSVVATDFLVARPARVLFSAARRKALSRRAITQNSHSTKRVPSSSGERTPLACWLRRLAVTNFFPDPRMLSGDPPSRPTPKNPSPFPLPRRTNSRETAIPQMDSIMSGRKNQHWEIRIRETWATITGGRTTASNFQNAPVPAPCSQKKRHTLSSPGGTTGNRQAIDRLFQ